MKRVRRFFASFFSVRSMGRQCRCARASARVTWSGREPSRSWLNHPGIDQVKFVKKWAWWGLHRRRSCLAAAQHREKHGEAIVGPVEFRRCTGFLPQVLPYRRLKLKMEKRMVGCERKYCLSLEMSLSKFCYFFALDSCWFLLDLVHVHNIPERCSIVRVHAINYTCINPKGQ